MTDTEHQLRTYLRQCTGLRMTMGDPPGGFTYYCAEDYVLDRGMTLQSEALSEEELAHVLAVAEAAEALFGEEGFQQKQCFANAAKLAIADDTHQLIYTEGYAVGGILGVHHAWTTLNRKVIDLTWRLDTPHAEHRFGDRILGDIPEERAYLGIGFQTPYLHERVIETERFLSLILDYHADYPLLREDRLSPLED